MIYKIFTDEQGKITETKNFYSDIDLIPNEGIIVDHEVNLDMEYWDGEVRLKPEMNIIVTGQSISNIPYPATLFIEGNEYQITENTVDLEFDTPGSHKISIRVFPYLDKEVTIEA